MTPVPDTHAAASAPQTQSEAFRIALLRSERLRIRVVLATLAAGYTVRTLRTIQVHHDGDLRIWLLSLLILAVFVAYELQVLRAVSRALLEGRNLAPAAWTSNILVETSLPAFATAFLASPAMEAVYRPITNPVTLGFFIFIILSTLRLNPRDSRLAGFVAAASYLLAASYLGWRPWIAAKSSVMSPENAVFAYAVMFVVAGFAAGAVAGEIRKHVNAALREAELRREMERLEHDMKVARSIQQSLLPTATPQIEGFEIAGWNQSADQTGGDYYDWQIFPSGKVLVAVADATGHGIGPALLAAVCRAYARANFTLGQELLPDMERINEALADDLTPGRFVTFVAAVCTPGSSRVELLSAGHGPLFVYLLREDRFDLMNAHGLPLGISRQLVSDPPQIVELEPGDILVLATDGFFEWENNGGEQFGTERMEKAIRESRRLPGSEMIANLYRGVLDFSGGTKQQDDLTAVIIKRNAS